MINLDNELKTVKSVAIAGHVRPDGDCVGSCMGLYNYIINNYEGVKADVYLNPIPSALSILKNTDKIINYIGHDVIESIDDFPKCIQGSYVNKNPYDLMFVLDCSDGKRLGPAYSLFKNAKRTICIDHHMNNGQFADEQYIIQDYSSTCELIYNIADYDKIDKSVAECLYTGMVTDTGLFQYDCTSADTMCAAGKLMDKGIDYSYLVEHTFFEKTYIQQKVLGKALLKSNTVYDGKIIYSYIDLDEMEELGADPKDFEGICETLRETKGVSIAFFMYRQKDGYIKGSLRGSDDTDLSKVASNMNGGGHKKAAGFHLDNIPMEEAKELVIKEIIKEYEIGNN
ncbi:MAG: bifunctional oligoribonuclease/PAP phosphatase NrnA [Lachnospiraceae bacterium]|nr:bifunctional oligoribonuclease/PAP phosphatase NrnA [Lachnospiraceae bacterium]